MSGIAHSYKTLWKAVNSKVLLLYASGWKILKRAKQIFKNRRKSCCSNLIIPQLTIFLIKLSQIPPKKHQVHLNKLWTPQDLKLFGNQRKLTKVLIWKLSWRKPYRNKKTRIKMNKNQAATRNFLLSKSPLMITFPNRKGRILKEKLLSSHRILSESRTKRFQLVHKIQ